MNEIEIAAETNLSSTWKFRTKTKKTFRLDP